MWNQFFVIEEYAGPEPVLIGKLHSDVDRGEGRTKYLLTGEGAGTVFVIDEATGNIHVTKSLDREEKAQYVLLAQAVDRASNRPLEPPSEFIIKVQDINDNPPIFPLGPYHATVPEMSNVGTSVIQVTAHDADDPSYGNSAKLVYTVLDGLPFFSVDPQTGVVRTAIPNMDRETQEEFLVAYTSSRWWRQLDQAPWWAGFRPRTQTWETTPSWHTASWMGRGLRPSASAQTPRVKMGSSLSESP